jgi:CRISPR-associated endoribonuclease Cas6
MPITITIHLETSELLFFDENWPLEKLLLEILANLGAAGRSAQRDKGQPRPYTLSPIWRESERLLSSQQVMDTLAYRWRVALLDDGLSSPFMAGLEATRRLDLDGKCLTVRDVSVEKVTYQQLAQEAQDYADARPNRTRRFQLVFITPVILSRSGLPMPLPDPTQVFRHYLDCWDTFAPRELWVNVNLLDAIQFHLAVTEHQLETRRVASGSQGVKIGFLGQVTYEARAWRKLGAEFLGHLHTLARFAEFCGTGELTTRGLGQTRYVKGR